MISCSEMLWIICLKIPNLLENGRYKRDEI